MLHGLLLLIRRTSFKFRFYMGNRNMDGSNQRPFGDDDNVNSVCACIFTTVIERLSMAVESEQRQVRLSQASIIDDFC